MDQTGVAEVIGLPAGRDALRLAGAAAAAGGRAGTLLGVLCGNPILAADLAARWKLSYAEAENATVAARVLSDPSDDPLRWIGEATDGTNPSRMVPVLVAMGRTAAAEALMNPIPVVPLRGRDLVEARLEPGPAVGAAMAIARGEWKASGFLAGRDELLAFALSTASRWRP